VSHHGAVLPLHSVAVGWAERSRTRLEDRDTLGPEPEFELAPACPHTGMCYPAANLVRPRQGGTRSRKDTVNSVDPGLLLNIQTATMGCLHSKPLCWLLGRVGVLCLCMFLVSVLSLRRDWVKQDFRQKCYM